MKIVIRKTKEDGIGNVLKAFISALGISNNVVIECNSEYIYGKYDTILDDKFIFKSTNEDIEYFYTCRLLVKKEEEELQKNIINEFCYTDGCQNPRLNHLFSFTKLIDWNYDATKICLPVKNRILNSINKIQFKECVVKEVELLKKLMINDNNTNLAISVRTWKASHEQNINRKYCFDTYKKKIVSVIQNNKTIKNVLFSIDNADYKIDYINLFKSLNVNLFILEKKDYLNEIQFAIIKVLILSQCNYLIANRISTFSELIFWFSECKIIVYPIF